MPSGKKSSKTSFVDRARKFGEKLLTRKNLAIAAPIIGAAAALASKRVRGTVGDAVKSAGETVGATTTAKPAAAKPAAAKPAASTAPKPASKRTTKAKAAGGDAKADKAKKPAAKRAPRKAKGSGGEGATGA